MLAAARRTQALELFMLTSNVSTLMFALLLHVFIMSSYVSAKSPVYVSPPSQSMPAHQLSKIPWTDVGETLRGTSLEECPTRAAAAAERRSPRPGPIKARQSAAMRRTSQLTPETGPKLGLPRIYIPLGNNTAIHAQKKSPLNTEVIAAFSAAMHGLPPLGSPPSYDARMYEQCSPLMPD